MERRMVRISRFVNTCTSYDAVFRRLAATYPRKVTKKAVIEADFTALMYDPTFLLGCRVGIVVNIM